MYVQLHAVALMNYDVFQWCRPVLIAVSILLCGTLVLRLLFDFRYTHAMGVTGTDGIVEGSQLRMHLSSLLLMGAGADSASTNGTLHIAVLTACDVFYFAVGPAWPYMCVCVVCLGSTHLSGRCKPPAVSTSGYQQGS